METRDNGILLVDDDPDVLRAVRRDVHRLGYQNLHTARNGSEALECLTANGAVIEVMLLDERMPVMRGSELLQLLVNTHRFPISVIMLTAYVEATSEREFFATRSASVTPVAYLAKPWDDATLAAQIERAIKLVNAKRDAWTGAQLQELKASVDRLTASVKGLQAQTPGFWASVGQQVLIAILLAVFVIVSLGLGLDDLISRATRR